MNLHPLWVPWVPARHHQQAMRVVKGKGCLVKLETGDWYLDASAGFTGLTLGHGSNLVIDAINKQLRQFAHFPLGEYVHEPALLLAERIKNILGTQTPWSFLTTSGSDGVEAALKMARIFQSLSGYPKRYKVLTLEGSYHGATHGGFSATRVERCRIGFSFYDQAFLSLNSPDPMNIEEEINNFKYFVTKKHPEEIACFMIELVKGVGGVRPLPLEYVTAVAKICKENNILLILDEVLTGCGNTGHWFAKDHYNITPDILVFSKGLTSAYAPLAVTSASEKIYDVIAQDAWLGGFRHGHTYSGHAVSCVAALATLEEIEKNSLISHSKKIGKMLFSSLLPLNQNDRIFEVRGLGPLLGIEFVSEECAEIVKQGCFKRKILLRKEGKTLAICPPLIVTEEEVAKIITAIYESIEESESIK